MELEILLATMNKTDYNFIYEMNINSNVIIANQVDHYSYCEYKSDFYIKMISTPYRGVGKNRNISLYASSGDICLLADDDIIYKENYDKIIKTAFNEIKDADIIIFNVERNNTFSRINSSIKRVRLLNLLNYGAVRIAFKRENILKNNISFSLSFGGGSYFGSGEDSLFLLDCYKRGLKIYNYPATIAIVNDSKSSWFNGYDEKFFYDKGKLYKSLFNNFYFVLVIYYGIKFKKLSKLKYTTIFYYLINGTRKKNMYLTYDEFTK